MDKIVKFESISQYNEAMGLETFHPLVSVVELEKMNPSKPMGKMRISYGF